MVVDELLTVIVLVFSPFQAPVAFGLLSRGNHMSLMFPGWYRDVVWTSGEEKNKSQLSSSALIQPSAEELKNVASTLREKSKTEFFGGADSFCVNQLISRLRDICTQFTSAVIHSGRSL